MAGDRPQRKYIAVLALVSALVLIIGARFKPQRDVEAPLPQAELRRLQLNAQRRGLEELTSYYAGIANQVKPSVLWLRELERTGVVWDARGTIITANPLEPVHQAPTTGPYRLTPEVVSIQYPVSALRAEPGADLQAVFRTTATTVEPGSWILQVSAKNDGGHLYAPGTFEGVVATECGDFRVRTVETNLPLDLSASGGGVFDLSGNLLGVILRCNGRFVAVTPDSIDRIIEEAVSFEGELLRRYGLRTETLTEAFKIHFGTIRGLLVTEVWNGWPADAAGVLPGDIIQALDDYEVNTIEDLERLVLPVAYPAFDLWIWRDKKTVQVQLPVSRGEMPYSAYPESSGIVLLAPEEGYLIDHIAPGSRAESATLRRGDRLLRVEGARPRNLEEALKVLAKEARDPVYVVVKRGRTKLGAFLR